MISVAKRIKKICEFILKFQKKPNDREVGHLGLTCAGWSEPEESRALEFCLRKSDPRKDSPAPTTRLPASSPLCLPETPQG